MNVLLSTYAPGDADKVLLAMRALPYDQLVLVGEEDCSDQEDVRRIAELEEMAGHKLRVEVVSSGSLLTIVDGVSDLISDNMRGRGDGRPHRVVVNISGGSKLLGDAALLASFRLGVESVHCDSKVVKLPVVKNATATDMFTPMQLKMIENLSKHTPLPELIELMKPSSKQATERIIRELRRAGLIESHVRDRVVQLALTVSGEEVLRAITLGRRA